MLSTFLNLMKAYNEETDERYFLEVDTQYLENVHDLGNGLTFLSKIREIEKSKKAYC